MYKPLIDDKATRSGSTVEKWLISK